MTTAYPKAPQPRNEPTLGYAPRSPERQRLERTLDEMGEVEIPLVIGGREVRTGKVAPCAIPHRHRAQAGIYHQAGPDEITAAVDAALAAHKEWSRMAPADRLAIFLRAAELAAGRFRPLLNASTMLGQSKTVHQAEIDATCETVDFLRWGVHFAERILGEQPFSPPGEAVWNQLDARPLEGFVLAIAPFNFTSISANLIVAPAIMGNTVVFKPSSTAVLSAKVVFDLLLEAGLPPGVVSFVPGPSSAFAEAALLRPELAGIHFTGSTPVFQTLWSTVGANIGRYRTYPRLVGETGGKNFVLAHASADLEALATAIVRGGYEYQGQKCSAASRVYVPASMWPRLRERLSALIGELGVGDVADFTNFMGAVIDRTSFERIGRLLDEARRTPGVRFAAGGTLEGEQGWFVAPTLVETTDPKTRLMQEEIFGPVVTVYPYPDGDWDSTLDLIDSTSPYALTGSIFSRERNPVVQARDRLRHSAGNFYINDKPTGAVVGQQPFGGARASGTNDKAGSLFNLLRWISPRTIKENLVPPTHYAYPYMSKE